MTSSSDYPQRKIIHIDDDPSPLYFTKLFLEKADPSLKVISVSSYDELKKHLTPEIECILSDYKMPIINGIDLCEIIKKETDIPFILYTGHGSETVAETAFAHGVDDYIRKEMDQSHYKVLLNRIIQTIEKHRSKISSNLYKKRLEMLHKYAVEISKASEIDEIAYQSFEAIKETLNISYAGFHILKGQNLIELFVMGATVTEPYIQTLDGPGVTIRAIKSGVTQVVPDSRQDADYVSWPIDLELLSEVAVPFSVNGQIEGVLNVESDRLDAFAKEDVALLEILGSYISSSLNRLKQIESYRESENRWKTYLESSMDAAFVIVGTKIVYANKRAAELLGYHDRSELIGINALSIVKEDDREMVKVRMLGRQRGEEQINQYDLTLLDKNGNEIEVETNASLVDYNGENASLSYCRDISARKSYERKLAALHKSAVRFGKAHSLEEVYDVILDTIGSVLGFQFAGIAIHEDGYLRYTRTRGVVFEREWVIPVSERCVTARTYRSKKTQIINDTRLDPEYSPPPTGNDFDIVTLSELAVPINENGNILGVINVESREASAFSHYDAELIEILAMHSASAMRRIIERNGLQKIIEQKTLEALETEKLQAIGKIVAMVAHDLRGPLQTIKNCVYCLGKDDEGHLDRINSSVDYSIKILEDLKDLSMNLPLHCVNVELRTLINESLKDIFIPDNVNVEVEVDEVKVQIDYVKVRRVLNNIIANSIDAMPHGGVLKILGYQCDGNVQIHILDDGIGIPKNILNKLFTDLITTKPNGNGLGLSYCKRIMETHEGKILIDSKIGAGTEVTLIFPESQFEPDVYHVETQIPIKE